MLEHERRRLPVISVAGALLVAPGFCSKERPSSPDASAVTSGSAPNTPASATRPSAPDASAAAEAARTAALERAGVLLEDIRWMVSKGVIVNPAKAGEGDVATKCDAVAATRSALGPNPDPELVTVLDEAADLCAFDVPLLTASEAIGQLRFSPSQASRLLMCNVAAREIDKARAVRPKDPRVQRLDARRLSSCK